MARRIVTFLSDFGLKDSYAATVKGVILRINPQVEIIDITHQIPAGDIISGSFALFSAYSFFPETTIHLAVVDPTVGSSRKKILALSRNYAFIGPDNGLFSLVFEKEKPQKLYQLQDSRYFLSYLSSTFQARDMLAPVAGYFSLGVSPREFGPEIKSLEKLHFPKPRETRNGWEGEIIHIDNFGNLISNIEVEKLKNFKKMVVKLKNRTISGISQSYFSEPVGKLLALKGSLGFLEIAANRDSAEKILKIKRKDKVKILFL